MLDDELKEKRKELEAAINEALSDSDRVGEIIRHIRSRGYDVFLIIEATVGFSQREDVEHSGGNRLQAAHLELTTQDERFLRSLKISPR
jgi:hypothetical protein